MTASAITASVDAFFYGLFMDEGVLAASGVAPRHGRKARLDGFALRIGKRATLVRQVGGTAWGMVFALTKVELDRLYGAPGLELYRPEDVEVVLENRAMIPAVVYTLVQPPKPHERNPDYAERLKKVLTQLEFPADYVASIA
jgi:Gamma-glutamyl cyclotransferase, AIG2-like